MHKYNKQEEINLSEHSVEEAMVPLGSPYNPEVFDIDSLLFVITGIKPALGEW
jgi:hypothetical protein